MMRVVSFIALGFACATLTAQADQPDPAEIRRSAQRALDQNRVEVERLIEMRLRHDLGLMPHLEDDLVPAGKPATTLEMAQQRTQLEKLVDTTKFYRGEYEKLQQALARLDEGVEKEISTPDEGQFIPSAGEVVKKAVGPTSIQTPTTVISSDPARVIPAAPAVEVAPDRVTDVDLGDLALDPLKAQINGSTDHLRVAQSLFKVGQALMDRGRFLAAKKRTQAAKELDDRAKKRLLRAVEELKPLTSVKDPEYAALFCLGRCLELLFRYSERHEGLSLASTAKKYQTREQLVRDPFLQISARDVHSSGEAGKVEVLGDWGQAAKTAMEHFRWMNLNANYDASAKIEALSWPGQTR
jgi:hypothetical protein